MGAILASETVSDVFQRGDHASTFGGGALVCAAALASIEVIKKEGLIQRSEELGAYMRYELNKLDCREVRGVGLMIGVDLEADCRMIVQKARERGVLLNNTGDNTLRLVPPLIVSKEQIDKVVRVIGETSVATKAMPIPA